MGTAERRKDEASIGDIHEATRDYERWVARQVRIVDEHLAWKHERMAEDASSFLRGTFYRWMQKFPVLVPDLMGAPVVWAIGDLHVDNFGTWRDGEGRLVWGINDFDEAFSLPYTVDLVRLATSVLLACDEQTIPLRPREASAAVLDGYRESLDCGGHPVILAERESRLHALLYDKKRDDPRTFWKQARALPKPKDRLPTAARIALEHALPDPSLPYRIASRYGGIGSLGRPRYVVTLEWRGSLIGREAKALTSSACLWAVGQGPNDDFSCEATMRSAVRSLDPFLRFERSWLVRRYGPESGRLGLRRLARSSDALRLLYAMGWECANVHLGTEGTVATIQRDLERRGSGWLNAASKTMAKDVRVEQASWRRKH